jgi:hypothetical protein
MNNKQIEKALYLPKDLRDFHNQKEFFKSIYDCFGRWNKKVPSQNIKNLSWVDLHILTTDFILFQLAQEGYVLKKDDRFK